MEVLDELIEVSEKIKRVEWFRNLKFWYDYFDILNYSYVCVMVLLLYD